jgi:Zinc finger, C2H2 type
VCAQNTLEDYSDVYLGIMSNKFSCEHCTYSTNRLYNLQRHIATRHATIAEQDNLHSGNDPVEVQGVPEKVHASPAKVQGVPEKVHADPGKVQTSGFKCEKCYKVFTRKDSLKDHTKICKAITSPLQCYKCHKILASKQSKCNHMKICKGEIAKEIVKDTVTSVHNIQNQQNNTHCTFNYGTVNNNNVTINIRNFGDENLDHITNEVLDPLVKKMKGQGIVGLIQKIHFNPDVPENHNIRRDENDRQLWKVFENGDWEVKSSKTTIGTLINEKKYMLKRRLSEIDFERALNDPITLKQLQDDYMLFDLGKLPECFWQCARDTYAALANFEKKMTHQIAKQSDIIIK